MNPKKSMNQHKELFIYIDGAAKGNPGPAGAQPYAYVAGFGTVSVIDTVTYAKSLV